MFGDFLEKHPEVRKKIIIQTKCGICNGYYDSSKEHILNSVTKSLKNFKTDYIDILLLHRPDTLMEPKEIAEAFNELYEAKKVKYFGVSNMNPYQMQLIQKYLKFPLVINQLQFSLVHAGMIDSGINANMTNAGSIDHDGSILEYCRLNDITIQPWSILQASWENGCFLNHPDYQNLNQKLVELATKYNVSKAAIAVSWILRHPADMQPICGTTSINNLEQLCQVCDVELSRKEWYELYLAVDRRLP